METKRVKMDTKASGYTVEIDKIEKDGWSELLRRFSDATIYQTWSYGSVRWGESNLSHFVLRKDGEIIAAAQLRIIKIPIFGIGIAYIPFGPLFRLKERRKDLEIFKNVSCALQEEYVMKRGLLLRIIPHEINDGTVMIQSILQDEGFKWQRSISSNRTFLIDLSFSKDELRKSLAQKWRNCLNRAERNKLTVIEGTGNNLYELFSDIYKEMHKNKKFIEFVDINKIRCIQKDLNDNLKMIIMLCEFDGEPVSALVCTAIGDTGIYLLGATNTKGRKLQGSYLLQWKVVEWLKAQGCLWYDLGGIDPVENPGTYHFKAGLAGKLGKEVRYIGQFEASQNLLSSFLVKIVDQLRSFSIKMKLFIRKKLLDASKIFK